MACPPQKTPKPPWLKKRLPTGTAFESVRSLVRASRLHTVCEEARCPNIWECYARRTATFMILGDRCSRNCQFCAVAHGPTSPPDPSEPERIARAAEILTLDYLVITSVTRDDLPNQGAGQFAAVISAVRRQCPTTRIEVLIPDFAGDPVALGTVLEAGPDVLNHNVETVPRLYPRVRPQASYRRSLALLAEVSRAEPAVPVKSGLMLGLGERDDEIDNVLTDIRNAGCEILTLGQYLQPTPHQLPVERYLTPGEFAAWRARALDLGFSDVVSGPFVRSSYQAEASFLNAFKTQTVSVFSG